jgi:hypothetical protein
MRLNRSKIRHLVQIGTVLATVLAAAQTPAAGAAAQLLPCERAADATQLSAIAAAQAWLDARWLALTSGAPASRGRITAYVIPPPPPAPLGIGALARAQDLGVDKDLPTTPIAGFARTAKLLCVAGASSADGSISVQFRGVGLHFREGAAIWSKPLPKPMLLHALVLTRPTPDAAWVIAEEPEARTALIPGSRLSVPTAADIRAALAPVARAVAPRARR